MRRAEHMLGFWLVLSGRAATFRWGSDSQSCQEGTGTSWWEWT